ncbi:hypothetical protein ACD578_28190 (plasmid) [Microvirga sp. RSM25]|uniref:hypothetical protein n=1 Tax=Microvirga sp. RSM25 TaxID=3273802 RepID=UPI00384FEF65
MAKKSKIIGDELVLTAKAIRRGEKLERTLTKLAVVQETGSAAEVFLKTVQKGLERLRNDESSTHSAGKHGKKKAADGAESQGIPQSEDLPALKSSRRPKKSVNATPPGEAQAD